MGFAGSVGGEYMQLCVALGRGIGVVGSAWVWVTVDLGKGEGERGEGKREIRKKGKGKKWRGMENRKKGGEKGKIQR